MLRVNLVVLAYLMFFFSTNLLFGIIQPFNNNFQKSLASDVNLKQNVIDELEQFLDLHQELKVNSISIIKNEKLVFEKYFHGFDSNKNIKLKSLGKSITSILLGIAIDKGFIRSVDEPIISFFPEFKKLSNWDNNKEKITIRHLITMSAGLDCGAGSKTNKCISEVFSAEDMFEAYFQLHLASKPGSTWFYNDGNVMIINRIIELASNMRLDQFQKKYLDSFLGIEGNYAMVEMRPKDMAKIGQLILNRGRWKGHQIVSEQWVNESLKVHFPVKDSFMGKSYGYFWWQYKFIANGKEFLTHYAYGNGGQFIFIIPDENLVVVFTGDNYNSYKSIREPISLLLKYVFMAV